MTKISTFAALLLTMTTLVAHPVAVAAQDAPAADPMPELLTQLGEIEARLGYLQIRFEDAAGEDQDLFAEGVCVLRKV